MKFWQLTSIFRDEEDLLRQEFSKEKWYSYLRSFENLESIVKNQERDILDAEVDSDLLEKICSKSNKKLYWSKDKSRLYSYKNSDISNEISILEAISSVNHNSIEEAFEKSYADIGNG